MMLRILGEKKDNYWIATSLEFNIVAQGDSFKEAVSSLEDALKGYLETVFDTDDALSIPELLYRPAPWKKRIMFFIGNKLIQCNKFRAQLISSPKYRTVLQAA